MASVFLIDDEEKPAQKDSSPLLSQLAINMLAKVEAVSGNPNRKAIHVPDFRILGPATLFLANSTNDRTLHGPKGGDPTLWLSNLPCGTFATAARLCLKATLMHDIYKGSAETF